jgi:hypothetical protein
LVEKVERYERTAGEWRRRTWEVERKVKAGNDGLIKADERNDD